jgi:putative FmdB family regulatory protein
MPLYEFECLECGAEFEKLVLRNSDITDLKCPDCNSRRLEEKISSFASISNNGASGSANCTPSGG